MSRARTEMIEILQADRWHELADDEIEHLAILLLPVVRKAIGRGFNSAADTLEKPGMDEHTPSEWLRLWGYLAQFTESASNQEG